MLGTSIFQYQVVEKLGAGGMGDIYKARDSKLNRFVAIKVLAAHSGGDDRRRRFFQEAQAASALNHPNIITIYDIITDGPVECIVMEYVSGKTLAELIPPGGMPSATVVGLGAQMAAALSAAHAAGIIHRDLKPGNVMVTPGSLVKVLDFGLAKLTEAGAVSNADDTRTVISGPLTVEGSIIGTVSYMSPEQAQGKKVDARSDIFAFGAVLYEMATGRRAFEGENTLSTLTAVLRDSTPPVAESVPGIPPEFDQLIHRCLRKLPEERYQSMAEVEAALIALKQRFDSGVFQPPPGVPATPVVPAAMAPPAAVKKRAPVALIGGLVVLLAAAGAGGWLLLKNKPGAAISQPPDASQSIASQPAATPTPQLPAEPATTQPEPARSSKVPAPADIQSGPPAARPGEIKPPEAPVAPSPVPVAETTAHLINVPDGTPFYVTLDEDIPSDAEEDRVLHFVAAADLKINGAVVISKGAPVTGSILEAKKKKMLGIGGKMTLRFLNARTVDGKLINIRATSARRLDGVARRPVEVPGSSRSKEFAAVKGDQYLAFVNGDASIAGKP